MGRELSTFGAILSFAIQLEGEAAAFYASEAWAPSTAESQATREALARVHRKHQRDGERVRREQVTEMILEPIYGLYEEDWHIDLSVADRAAAVELENKLGAFYTAAAGQVALPAVARYLTKVSAEAEALARQAATLP